MSNNLILGNQFAVWLTHLMYGPVEIISQQKWLDKAILSLNLVRHPIYIYLHLIELILT